MTEHIIGKGSKISVERIFNQSDFNRFAEISKDDNPIHVDPEFSAKTKFGKTVAHGMFLYANILKIMSFFLGNIPFFQLSQDMMFPNPIYANESIRIELKITNEIEVDIYEVETLIRKLNNELGLQGRSIIQILKPTKKIQLKTLISNENKDKSSETEFKKIKLHQKDVIRENLEYSNLIAYLDLLKDSNRFYKDPNRCHTFGFENILIPGALLGSIISFQLGTRLPGKGTNWLKCSLKFLQPIFINQKITSELEVIRIRSQKQLINLKATCYNEENKVVAIAEILVLVSDLIG